MQSEVLCDKMPRPIPVVTRDQMRERCVIQSVAFKATAKLGEYVAAEDEYQKLEQPDAAKVILG